MTSSQLDSLRRTPAAGARAPAFRYKSWLLIPGLLLGFGLLVSLIFGDDLRPRPEVKTSPARLIANPADSSAPEPAGVDVLSQASGWIEPDPFALRVPVLVDGIMEEVHVLAGETVEKGQLLATLDASDITLELKALKASLQAAEAMREEKEHRVTRATAEHRKAQAETAAAEARLAEQQDRLRRLLGLEEGVVPEDDRLRAEREVAVGKAERAAAFSEQEARAAHAAVERAGVKTMQARVEELKARVERAELDLKRTRILSPADGVVLRRFATPGGKHMRAMDDPDSATVVSLYQPEKLQARVDVPLADAARITTGMKAILELSAFPGREFSGKVTRIVGEADLTRNTLQVKVAIEDPDPRMRPEMLCRVEFFMSPDSGKRGEGLFRSSESVWIPAAALQADRRVWVVDPVSSEAEPREVKRGGGVREDHISIAEGLRPGERVLLEVPVGLNPGDKVKEIREEV